MSRLIEVPEQELAELKLASEHEQKIREMEREATIAKAVWEDAKDESLAAKKSYDQKMNELRKFIAAGPSPQLSLFGGGNAPQAQSTLGIDHPKTWADKSVDDLPLSEKMIERLHEIGVHTLGQCETLRAGKVSGFPKGAASVGGWGPKKVAEFEDAVIAAIPLDDALNDADGELSEEDVIEDAPEPVACESDDTGSHLKVHAEDDDKAEIVLTKDIDGMTDEGLVSGARFTAEIVNGNAIVNAGGQMFQLASSEYEIVPAMADAV